MNQSEYFGVGCVEKLKEILIQKNPENIFLISGKKSFKYSGAEKIFNDLLKDYTLTYFNDISGDPKIENVIKGMDHFMEAQCDIVIAVGGGSVIDTAKSINILSSQEANPESIITGREKIVNKGKPLIAIPSTSGAGSEATHFAVVYINKEKYSLANEFILPDYSIIDPQLTFNLPAGITATSGIDAFSQAVESYWNVNSNIESKEYSAEAITLILNNLKSAVNNPTIESRINMSKAAHLAGKAINLTKTTAPHAVSYSMTSFFGIPHGQAVCITLGAFLEYNYNIIESDSQKGTNAKEVKSNIEDLMKLFKCKTVLECKGLISDLISDIGLKVRLSDLNIKNEEDIKKISNNINMERLNNNPRLLKKEDLINLLRNLI